MATVTLSFSGESMPEVRQQMQEWAAGFAEPEATAPPAPPKRRSFKHKPVEAPVAEAEEQLDLLAPTPQAAPAEEVGVGGSEAVVAAATRFAERYGKADLKKLLKQFGVTKVRDLAAEQQVQFITACARGPA